MKAIDVFLTTIFRTCLQPYFRLATMGMKKNTLIKHKEVVVICEESGMVIANYNALRTHPKSKLVAQPSVTYITFKQHLTCSNCGKISHAKETCHKIKKENLTVPIVPIKVVELIVEGIA